jgi:signal peptidase II
MRRSLLYFFVIAGAALAADQLSKAWARSALWGLPEGLRTPEHTVIPGIFGFIHAENTGATFSLLGDTPEWFRLPFFALIAAGAAIGISIYYARMKGRQLIARTALALLWAGALGNLVDRLRFRYVVDFIDVHYYDRFTWGTFNVADAAIVVGALALIFFGQPKKAEEAKPA